MIVTELSPRSLDSIDIDDDRDAARAWIAARYGSADPESVRLNMITSLTGSAVGVDGTSETLTGGADRLILSAIRAAADAVIVGAQTVRAEGYLLPRSAALAVVTRSGSLEGLRMPDGAQQPLIVLCPVPRAKQVKASVAHLSAEVVGLPADEPTPELVVDALRDRGLRHLVCEGGPSLARQFADSGVIDEYCVTVAPALTPVEHPFLGIHNAVATELAGHLVDDEGFTYLRLRAR
ncbi:dihydrofolate reductase family protein [Microbacterium sp.]|uniref:dihydrofolate reductase family protein n=1 Tax=Microbacterium sp. TaxID=51671 RepID=UPI0026153D62|nr:dihydrofolate reductase family protein [Microbacterium sp.]